MNKHQVEIGGTYRAKISGKWAKVRIEYENAYGGWDAVNLGTQRAVRIRTAARLWSLDMTIEDIQKELKRREYFMEQRGKPA